MSAEIKQYSSDEKPALVDFLNQVLAHRMLPEDWEWEYESQNDTFSFVTIQSDGKFLGSQGFIPINLVINKDIVLTGKSENSYLDSSLRGAGWFEKLYENGLDIAMKKKQSYIWGFTALTKVWRNRLNFYVNEDSIYESILTVSAFTESNKNPLYYFYQLFKSLKTKATLGLNLKPGSFTVQKALNDSKDLMIFYEFFDNKYPNLIRLHYSVEYVKWRIRDIKACKYEEIYLYDNTKLVGYAFVNVTNKSHLYISDIMFTTEESKDALIREIMLLCKNYNSKTIRYFGNRKNTLNSKVFDILKFYGAKESHNVSMNFVLKKIVNTTLPDEIVFDIKNWLINGLFTEGFKI